MAWAGTSRLVIKLSRCSRPSEGPTMFNLKVAGRILLTALKWAAVWALTGAVTGVVATLIDPDTGHTSRVVWFLS